MILDVFFLDDPVNHMPSPPTVVVDEESGLGVCTVSDADDDLRQTVLSVDNGTLSVDGTAPATSITIPGSVADVNEKLKTLKYTCGVVGVDTFTMVSTDEAGGVATTTLQINVQTRSK